MMLSESIIRSLPKTDLHCHYDGSLRIQSVIDIARRRDVKLFSYDAQTLQQHYNYGQNQGSLVDYLKGFEPLVAVLQHEEDIEQTFYEVCEDAASENVRHLELRYCPFLHIAKGLTPEQVIKACLRGGQKAQKDFGLSLRHILCGLKHRPVDEVYAIAKLAVEFQEQGIAAFDLAGPEIGFPIKLQQKAIEIIRNHYLYITMHAGEACGPESIAEALIEACAHRIGHGTSLPHDPKLMRYVIDHRIGIESCPTSNLQTGSVFSWAAHPLKKFLEADVQVSINTDNRLVSQTTITNEVMAAIKQFNLSSDQVRRLLQNGFESAFLPYHAKNTLLNEFNAAWERLLN